MPRYVAFLRGVSPMNARMPELKHCFEAAGFSEVRTLLSSGNVVFSARSSSTDALARRCEQAMRDRLDRAFTTFVRPTRYLQEMIEANPFARFDVPPDAKRVVTFFRGRAPDLALPIARDGAAILAITGSEAFTYYTPRQGSRLHDAAREDLRQGHHHPHDRYRPQVRRGVTPRRAARKSTHNGNEAVATAGDGKQRRVTRPLATPPAHPSVRSHPCRA